ALFSAWWLSAAVGDPIGVVAALHPEPFGVADPIFGRDASYYVFQWPILRRLQTLAALVIFWIGLLSVGAYVVTGAIKFVGPRLTITPVARKHLGGLAAGFLILHAINV